ncbi:MAG: hypothetical protein VR78_12535 [Hoeflea sp. BRH_c9]|nr:MAG: hypothetical protein VR78_12535 [Hoeflea sp. BRH_c9]
MFSDAYAGNYHFLTSRSLNDVRTILETVTKNEKAPIWWLLDWFRLPRRGAFPPDSADGFGLCGVDHLAVFMIHVADVDQAILFPSDVAVPEDFACPLAWQVRFPYQHIPAMLLDLDFTTSAPCASQTFVLPAAKVGSGPKATLRLL